MMISRKSIVKDETLKERKYYVLEFYTEQISLALKCTEFGDLCCRTKKINVSMQTLWKTNK